MQIANQFYAITCHLASTNEMFGGLATSIAPFANLLWSLLFRCFRLLTKYLKEFEKEVQARASGQVPIDREYVNSYKFIRTSYLRMLQAAATLSFTLQLLLQFIFTAAKEVL